MKSIKIAAVFFTISLFSTGALAKVGDVAGFVIAVKGSVVAVDANGKERALKRRAKFYSNEVIKTSDGASAQLRFKDRALMRLREKSELNIADYHFGGASDPKNKAVLKLVSGGFRTISGSIGKANKSAYRIDTPAASIGIRGTDYEIVIALDGGVYAAVWDGGVTMVNDLGELDLGSDGNYIFASVGSGQAPQGMENMPSVFNVENGVAKPLTAEQKAKIAAALGKVKVKSAPLDPDQGQDNEQYADSGKTDNDTDKLNETDFSLTLEELEQLEAAKEGNVAFRIKSDDTQIDGLADIEEGVVIRDDNGNTAFITQSDEIIPFDKVTVGEDALPTIAHANIDWGTWDDRPEDDSIHWIDAKAYDPSAAAARTGTVNLSLANFGAGTNINDVEVNESSATGTMTVDFDTLNVAGELSYDLDVTGADSDTTFSIETDFNGNINSTAMNSGSLLVGENDFDDNGVIEGIERETIGLSSDVKGVLVEPGADGDAFAGAFSVTAPLVDDNDQDIDVAIQGLFVMQEQAAAVNASNISRSASF